MFLTIDPFCRKFLLTEYLKKYEEQTDLVHRLTVERTRNMKHLVSIFVRLSLNRLKTISSK